MLVIQAYKDRLHVVSGDPISSGSVDSQKVLFEFEDKWNEYIVTAQFEGCGNIKHLAGINRNTEYNIPWECITHEGELKISLFGIKHGSRTTAICTSVHIADSNVDNSTMPTATPDAFTQLVSQCEEIKDSSLRWVRLVKSTLHSETDYLLGEYYKNDFVQLYGAAVKYKAPKRTDGKSFAAYLQLVKREYDMLSGTPIDTVRSEIAINSATRSSNKTYGAAMIDCSRNSCFGWSISNEGEPNSVLNYGLMYHMPFEQMLSEINLEGVNTVRFYSPWQSDGSGPFQAGTEYELWGLVKQSEV